MGKVRLVLRAEGGKCGKGKKDKKKDEQKAERTTTVHGNDNIRSEKHRS
jgi:hypothetical protein